MKKENTTLNIYQFVFCSNIAVAWNALLISCFTTFALILPFINF